MSDFFIGKEFRGYSACNVFGHHTSEQQQYYFDIMKGRSTIGESFYSINYKKMNIFISDPVIHDKIDQHIMVTTDKKNLAFKKYLQSLLIKAISKNFEMINDMIDDMINLSYQEGVLHGREAKAKEISAVLNSY